LYKFTCVSVLNIKNTTIKMCYYNMKINVKTSNTPLLWQDAGSKQKTDIAYGNSVKCRAGSGI